MLKVELMYKRADINDIDDIIDLKIKQNVFICNMQGKIVKDEDIVKENTKKVLLHELNKTIYFFIAIDKSNNRRVACNGVIIHQLIPSTLSLNGKKAYITTVYTDEDYRCMGIQHVLMNKVLNLLGEMDCKKIELDTNNPDAIKLYEKFGFKKDDKKYILEN